MTRNVQQGAGGGVALRVANVGMRFPDGTLALEDISLSVLEKEFVSIVGPSGCGKSTLLRLVSGLTTPTTGQVSIDRSRLGYTFQDASLLPWRTVSRNVELLLEVKGVSRAQRRKASQRYIDLVGLSGFEEHYPRRLSGGMKMRASLARWLTLAPEIFLFDEPFGSLDAITRERLNDELLSLFQSQGFSALFITHSISEACFLSSRVLVMSPRPGHIVEEFDVPFPYPRPVETRYEPEFGELMGRVSNALRHPESAC